MGLATNLQLNAVIGDEFRIEGRLGEGGMGVVYAATHLSTGHRRAVKVMHAPFAMDLKARERFEQEARIGAQIHSDHVVQVVAAGIDERTHTPWLAMELLEGRDLEAHIKEHGAMSMSDVALVMGQVTHGLAAAHDVGVVHRDIKPENVFLSISRVVGVPFMVKMLDFGIAKLRSSTRAATVAVGTPGYMAPEQTHASHEIGPPADVWSVGLMVFRMLTGEFFWKAASGDSNVPLLWREMLVDPIPTARERARELGCAQLLPEGFDPWFARCVDREPAMRYPHAREAGRALAEVFAGAGVAAPVVSKLVTPVSVLEPGQVEVPGQAEAGQPTLGTTPMRGGPESMAETHYSLAQVRTGQTVHAGMGPGPSVGPHAGPDAASHRVSFREEGERVVTLASEGETLLEVSLAAGIPHFHACGGKARCSTCRVVVLEGRASLSPRSEAEEKIAARRKWSATTRLACQARVQGPCTVRRLVIDSSDASMVDIRRTTQAGADTRAVEATVLVLRLDGIDTVLADGFPDDAIHVLERCLVPIEELLGDNGGRLVGLEGTAVVAAFESGEEGIRRALRASLRAVMRIRRLNPYLLKHFGAQVETAAGLGQGILVEGTAASSTREGQVLLGAAVRHARGACELARSGQVLARPELLVGQELVTTDGPGGLQAVIDFAKSDVVYLVQSSFDRLGDRAFAFAEAFYNELFELHPAAAPMFEHTDMERQKRMLMDTLALAVRGLDDFGKIEPAVRELGERHVDYGVELEDYKYVGQALLSTLARFLGDAFTAEAELAWREVYSTLVRTMNS